MPFYLSNGKKARLNEKFLEGNDYKWWRIFYLKFIFTKISNVKVKERIFFRTQTRQAMKNQNCDQKLNDNELDTWTSLKSVVKGFLGNHRAENAELLVNNLLHAYKKMGCRMSLNIHFLQPHFPFYLSNLGAVSDEQEESCH